MASGDRETKTFHTVRFPYIGVFKTRKRRVEAITEASDRKRKGVEARTQAAIRDHNVFLQEQGSKRPPRNSKCHKASEESDRGAKADNSET